MKWLERFSNEAYALLRIMTGFMFSFHGAQKILRIFAEGMPAFPAGSQAWWGGIIELIGGVAVMLGFRHAWRPSFAVARWPWRISSFTGNSRWAAVFFRSSIRANSPCFTASFFYSSRAGAA